MMGYGYGGFGWIGMILGLVITIAVIVGVILLVVWAVRRMNGNSAQPGAMNLPGSSAKEIAQARYAKGEITSEQYHQILSDIGR